MDFQYFYYNSLHIQNLSAKLTDHYKFNINLTFLMENLIFTLEGTNRSSFRGPNANSSHNGGHDIRVIKSSFQKYIRRGNFPKALYWTMQMFLMNAKFARTNMINRLTVIVTEDVSPSEWWLVLKSDFLLHKIKKYPLEYFKKADIKEIVQLLYYLCQAKKSRINSHLNRFYAVESRKKPYPERFPSEKETLESYIGKKELAEERCKAFSFVMRMTEEKLKAYLEKFTTKNQKLKECIYVLIDRYKTLKHKERPRYLHHAFLLILFEDLLDWKFKPQEPEEGYLAGELKKVQEWINKDEKIVPDDYCLDIHTKRKKKTFDDIHEFRNSGAHVENPCELLTFKFFKEFYEQEQEVGKGKTKEKKGKKGKEESDGEGEEEDEDDVEVKGKKKKVKREKTKKKEEPVSEKADDVDNEGKMVFEKENEQEEEEPVKKSEKKSEKKKVTRKGKSEAIDRSLSEKILKNVYKLEEAEIADFEKLPSAQLLTGKHKKRVKVKSDAVLKGPYRSDEEKLLKNITYTRLLDDLENDLQLSKEMRSALPIKRLLKAKNGAEGDIYIEFDNVGDHSKMKVSKKSSKIQPEHEVCERDSFVNRVSEIIGSCSMPIKKASICHLYLRRVLNVGDSGFHNILKIEDPKKFGGQLVAGIDLEENKLENGSEFSFANMVSTLDKCSYFESNQKVSEQRSNDEKSGDRSKLDWVKLDQYLNWDLSYVDIFSRPPAKELMKLQPVFEEVKTLVETQKKKLLY